MNISNEFAALKQKKFVDRNEFFKLINDEIFMYSNTRLFHKVISIYGMGGIGKSRFLKELYDDLKTRISEEYHLFYSTLEIDNKNSLYSLIRVRKQITKPCYLFDYAIISLTEKCFIEKINDDFINVLKTNVFTSLVSLIQEGIGNFVPSGLSLNGSIEFINEIIIKGKQHYTKGKYKGIIGILNDLIDVSPKRLLELLPILLGYDVKEHYYLKKKVVFIIDAYDICENNWIEKFIDSIGFGLFIITSREKINWQLIRYVETYQMEEIPKKEAKEYLREYISKKENNLINQIINSTECIPIYLDLAISTYIRLKDSEKINTTKNLSFKNKSDIIKNFLNHLTNEEQNTILVLSIIDIFDENIFDHLVADLNLPISKTQYNDFCSISIIDSYNNENEIKMFHNIFHVNISEITNYEIKYKIFKSYLSFISTRGIFLYQSEELLTFFDNIIHLIQLNKFSLSISETEKVLDIFFVLYENNIIYNVKNYSEKNYILFTFLKAVKSFRKDINSSIKLFEKIDGYENTLGKHKNSYYAIFYYVKSISGKYSVAEENILSFHTLLDQSSILDWYYGKIKIYHNDLLMLKGQFKSSILGLEDYRNEIISYKKLKADDIMETLKQIGHCYRFNFILDEAETLYNSLLNEYSNILPFRCYILTSLCETNCYFNPIYVINNYRKALKLTKSIGQMRSYAKILYSLGIAEVVIGNMNDAKKHINESIRLNQEIGYKSGVLFGLIAKSYYIYSKKGAFPSKWITRLENTISELKVYKYLMLPIYMLLNDNNKIEKIKNENEWINWQSTYDNYKQFLNLL